MRVLVASLALVALTGCGSVHTTTPASASQPIPWLPLPGQVTAAPETSPQPYPVPPGTAPCAAGDLHVLFNGSQGATGNVVAGATFSGADSTPCFLEGTPKVTLLDAHGHDVAFAQRAPYFQSEVEGPALILPGPPATPHTELTYGQASLTIDWESQPEACSGQSGTSIAGARIAIPAGGTVVIQISGAPAGYACQGVGVSSFEGPAMPAASPPPGIALPAVTLHAPSSARAGADYRYTVTLTNESITPLDLLLNCPDYIEALVTPGVGSVTGKGFYQLNCGPAGTLAPNGSATFAMTLDVPVTLAPGTYTLTFMLGFPNAFPEGVKPSAQVTVD